MKKITAILTLFCILAIMLCACGQSKDEKMIEERMNTFLEAYNAGDMDIVLECMDSGTRKNFESMIELYGMLGISVADLLDWGMEQVSGDGSYKFSDMEIDIISETRATVRVIMYYEGSVNSENQEMEYTLVKENGEWLLVG